MPSLIEYADNLRSLIQTPELEDASQQMIWMMGKAKGADVVRTHVRHHSAQPLPFRYKAPVGVVKVYGEDGGRLWLDGFNAVVNFIAEKASVAMFYAKYAK
jgi:hypothetical protein